MTPREEEKREFRERASRGRVVPVARVFPSGELAPVDLFRRMRDRGEECFLLESAEGADAVARYTFLGCGPVARLTINGASIQEERGGRRRPASGPALQALERLALRPGFVSDPEFPPLSSGAVGYLGYDAVRLFEEIPDRHPRGGDIPDGLFLLFDAAVVFDHPNHRLLLLTTIETEGSAEGDQAAEGAIARLDRLETLLRQEETVARRRADDVPRPAAFEPGMSRRRFLTAVARAKEAIFAGDIYQVVISQRWTAPLDVDPFDVYRALRMLNPSPYLFYLETREAVLFGASPEMLVRCRGRVVETRPIAGTALRGVNLQEDDELAARLLEDPKERSEHVMLVDLARNDLGRVCAIGSVAVPRYASIERYSHVQHLVSEVKGTLAAGKTAADALAACFPAGTLTGAPKIRAMELIDELEESRRGIYGGAVGYLDCGGNLDVAIAIRMAVVENGICSVQAGAGIVADSIPENEYRETESKAAALFRAIEIARDGLLEGTREP